MKSCQLHMNSSLPFLPLVFCISECLQKLAQTSGSCTDAVGTRLSFRRMSPLRCGVALGECPPPLTLWTCSRRTTKLRSATGATWSQWRLLQLLTTTLILQIIGTTLRVITVCGQARFLTNASASSATPDKVCCRTWSGRLTPRGRSGSKVKKWRSR